MSFHVEFEVCAVNLTSQVKFSLTCAVNSILKSDVTIKGKLCVGVCVRHQFDITLKVQFDMCHQLMSQLKLHFECGMCASKLMSQLKVQICVCHLLVTFEV